MPKFTDRWLASFSVEPGQKDRLAFDTECPGLGVRVTGKGTKAFLCQWTDPATKRKVREALGLWGSITVDQARSAARIRLGDVAKGIDPAAERARRKAQDELQRAEMSLSLNALIDDWARLHLVGRRPRYAAEAQRAIRLAFADHLNKPAARLTRATAIGVLDKMAADGKAITAGRTMAYARACYAWAERRGKVPSNPFSNLPVASGATERDRVLGDLEIWEIWQAALTLPYPFGPFYQVALLTLQRREEVAGMRWSEISADGTRWTIPPARMKNSKAHDVHLSTAAREVLLRLPRRASCDLVFTTNGRTPISGYSKARKALDKQISQGRGVKPGDPQPEEWRMHDFRRSGVSRLAGMGFDSIVVDMLLAHRPGKLKGVAGIYQRHDFWAERVNALDAWSAHVTKSGAESNVVPLRA